MDVKVCFLISAVFAAPDDTVVVVHGVAGRPVGVDVGRDGEGGGVGALHCIAALRPGVRVLQ